MGAELRLRTSVPGNSIVERAIRSSQQEELSRSGRKANQQFKYQGTH